MKRFIIITLLMLLLLALAVFLMPAAEGQAKTKVPEIPFEEQISNMIREHKIMQRRLIAYMEHQKEEINLLAEVIYHENWHTDKDKRAAYLTGAVVMNRVNSKKWPNTVKDVLYQKNQYSTIGKFFTKEIPEECYEMARDIYKNGTPDVPYNIVFQATFKQGYGDWGDPINGEHFCYGEA